MHTVTEVSGSAWIRSVKKISWKNSGRVEKHRGRYGNRKEDTMKATSCDYCANYAYDEESESYFCDVNLDEDEYYRFISTEYKECPYYRSGDEYKVVRHQM